MGNFVVSARKYRPQRFDEVVGQQHVSATLKNALQNDHLAHAFLFCGPRGVGKTTCARILAKVLNCQNVTSDYEPCNSCPSCEAFNENASFNITELDAASNNSVEHIRALIEQVRFAPQQGKYKVFIIDEVHMLSQQAFNAFLKTLEEPPAYAIFILATTEKHKIIPTILSRCQIFDFRRIQVPDIVGHLQTITQEENIAADKDALHIIAQKADGALRDALSIFDRVVSYSGDSIRYADVIENLNVLDYDYYFRLLDALLTEDRSATLLIFDEILRKGFDGDIFLLGLAEHLRQLLVCRDPATLTLLEAGDELRSRYQSQAQLAHPAFLLTALQLANECDIHYKQARNKRLHVEMALLKMCYAMRATERVVHPPTAGAAGTAEPTQSYSAPSKATSTEQSTPRAAAPTTAPKPTPDAKRATPAPATDTVVATPSQPATPSAAPPDRVAAFGSPAAAATATVESAATPTGPTGSSLRTRLKKKKAGLLSVDSAAAAVQREEEARAAKGKVELTQPALDKAWQSYSDSSTSRALQITMKSARVAVSGATEVNVMVGNDMQRSELEQEKQLLPYLRGTLDLPELRITYGIDTALAPIAKKPEREKKMTNREKFFKMVEINDALMELGQRFELKVDNT